jgi:hypothetical protein
VSTHSDTEHAGISLDPPEAENPAETPEKREREESEARTDTGAEEKPGRERRFGSLTPQEAGRRSAQARRERAIAQDEATAALSDGRVVLVRIPVHLGNIVARLNTQAQKGDTRAASELRTWMREYPAEDTTDLAALDARTRQDVLARVLADIEAEEGADHPVGPLPS